jgi:hypothetical protein
MKKKKFKQSVAILDLVDLVFFFFRGWVGQFHLLYKINGNLMMNGVGHMMIEVKY